MLMWKHTLQPVIKLTKHLRENKQKRLEMRFYLNGLEEASHYGIIKQVLQDNFGVKIITEFFGIWFFRAEIQRDEDKFVLYWDEDLGNFLVSLEQSDDKNERLEQLIKQAIPLIERHFGTQ